MPENYDFMVIGGGIAGTSIAAHLARHGSVRLLEMEDRLGYHSTGRSAAVFSEAYGNATIRALTRASRHALFSPPASFCAVDLIKPRQVLIIARPDQAEAFERFIVSASGSERLDRQSTAEALALCPVLRPEALGGAAISRNTADIDVHELHQGFLRMFKAHGGIVSTDAKVLGLEHDEDAWRVATSTGAIRGTVVVNAAGAWAGEIGGLAGARDIGLRPLKRTACLIDPPAGHAVAGWPMILNVEEEFYLKPDAGMLLLSPADQGETDPCDAQADELDIAIAIDRLEQATTLEVKRVGHRWAGLRSFVADSSPVVGYDPVQPAFFWLAALGGYGIQTAPALGRIAASLASGRPIDDDLLPFGVEIEAMSPGRHLAVSSDAPVIGVAKL